MKSDIKRKAVQDPIGAAYRIAELETKLALAEVLTKAFAKENERLRAERQKLVDLLLVAEAEAEIAVKNEAYNAFELKRLKAELEEAPVIFGNPLYQEWNLEMGVGRWNDTHKARLVRIEELEKLK